MADITELILNDHERFRRQFFALDAADGPEALAAIWQPLAELLEVHAAAEEAIFYPELLKRGVDGKPETKDAIKDHNKIRDAVRDAAQNAVGDKKWWAAVKRALDENSDHMAEEERGALPDFREHASESVRNELGARFSQFLTEHKGARGIDVSDKDPGKYIRSGGAEAH